MPGINTTGLPNTDDYNLGRGIVYFAPVHATTKMPLAYRDLGNVPEFSIAVETETLEHQSSRTGLKVTDKEVLISQKITLSLTLDEINFENLAVLLSGTTGIHTNPARTGGIAEHEAYASAVLGRWYDIRNTGADGARGYDIQDTADVNIRNGTSGPPGTDLVDGIDYTLDTTMGRFFLLSTATKIVAGEPIDVEVMANGTASDLDEVRALTQTSIVGALKFIAENPASNDHKTEFQFHKVSLKAEGDFSLIGDEFTQMQFTAVAEKEVNADANSGTLTIRTIAA